MATCRKPGRARLSGVLVLLALIGLPLALGEHHHGGLDPVEGAAPVALPVPLVSRPLAAPDGLPSLPSSWRPAPCGRAPPASPGV
jgi:hypothetical protein